MEKLIKHTSRLVARHNCVVLPGLGALLAQEIPAFYNAKDDIVRAYKLFQGDVFALSTEGFDGTPVKDATVSFDSTTYQVEVQ